MYVASADETNDDYVCTRLDDVVDLGKLAYWTWRVGKWLLEHPVEP